MLSTRCQREGEREGVPVITQSAKPAENGKPQCHGRGKWHRERGGSGGMCNKGGASLTAPGEGKAAERKA